EFHVPVSVLMAMSYNQTRWHQHNGQPSTSGGYGIMHLTHHDQTLIYDAKGVGDLFHWRNSDEGTINNDSLEKAAELLGVKPDVLKTDTFENIRGGAALLAFYAKEINGERPEHLEDWFGAVAKYSNTDNEALANDFASQVYMTIQDGVEQ